MANPHRGEVTFEVDGKSYTLMLNTNAICELEAEMNKGIDEIAMSMTRLSTLRGMLWAALRAHHPEVTLPEAGAMIDKVRRTSAMKAVNDALAAAFPKPDPDAKAGPENPQ